jgi:membrane-associated protease RseP (regulator of RpoE activity)
LSNDPTFRPPPPADDPFPQPVQAWHPAQPFPIYAPRKRFQHVWWKHIALFLITLVTTTLVGEFRYLAFLSDFGRSPIDAPVPNLFANGLWYSLTILTILGAHEMGHYIACRIYRVDATLPYFIPLYLGFGVLQIGTLGAVIRIKEPFPTRKILFDIGIAGPIAGFVVLVPALFFGMYMSTMTVSPPPDQMVYIGKPLLFRLARWMVFGPVPDGSIVNLHPMVFGAWFGMLATALNLLPFGQLDGGHITYATLGRVSTPISLATIGGAIVMTFFSLSWILMTILMVLMLLAFGPRHPPVLNDYEPIGRGRKALAIFALAMLVLCFTPFPIQL